MDEEITIINTKTRNEKIINFFIENKKYIFIFIAALIILVLGFYSYLTYDEKKKNRLSDKFNDIIIQYEKVNKSKTISSMREIIKEEDATYSPLALYFLLDNKLLDNKSEANDLFDILIDNSSLDYEIKNLIIYKKALFNADVVEENELIEILNPITKSESIWKSHSLYLIAEYFYAKNQKVKSKEFFEKILTTKEANKDIVLAAQKRLNRDLSD
tara:strand:- start:2255 stop:2899 length:645 start_codon:yes stop_codon:yes gene_type:complete